MTQAQASPAFILEENFEDFLDPAWVHTGPVLSKRVFPTASPPPLLLQGDLRVEMLDGVAGVGSAEVTFRLTAGVLKA